MNKCGDVLKESCIKNLLTEFGYDTLKNRDSQANPYSDDEKRAMKLYEDNANMGALFTLGQKSNAGAMVLAQTVTNAYVHGKVWQAFQTLDGEYQPVDMTAEVELEQALEKIHFNKANEYYTRFVEVSAGYQHKLSEKEKLKIMVKKCTSPTYAVEIRKQMLDANGTLAKACTEIAAIQRLVHIADGPKKPKEPKKEKEVSLGSTEGGGGKKKCSHCGATNHKRADCTKLKAALKKQGNCPECDKPGHLESECWKKDPSKAPKWWGKKDESSNANVELMIASVETEQDFA